MCGHSAAFLYIPCFVPGDGDLVSAVKSSLKTPVGRIKPTSDNNVGCRSSWRQRESEVIGFHSAVNDAPFFNNDLGEILFPESLNARVKKEWRDITVQPTQTCDEENAKGGKEKYGTRFHRLANNSTLPVVLRPSFLQLRAALDGEELIHRGDIKNAIRRRHRGADGTADFKRG